ncbi:helix-turn-helix domain-containing protein [Streptomyces sp. NPDC001220]
MEVDVELSDLRIFLAVARTHGITKAAQELHTVQSYVCGSDPWRPRRAFDFPPCWWPSPRTAPASA